MPIVDVELVGPPAVAGLARALADDLGRVFGAAPGTVWVRVRALDAGSYAENGAAAAAPVFVTLLLAAPPARAALGRLVADVADAVARGAGRPRENVHVLLEPAAKGRIAFGGRLPG